MTKSEAQTRFDELTGNGGGWAPYTVGGDGCNLSRVRNPSGEFEGNDFVLLLAREEGESEVMKIDSMLCLHIRRAASKIACENTPEGYGVGSSDVNCYINRVCFDLFLG